MAQQGTSGAAGPEGTAKAALVALLGVSLLGPPAAAVAALAAAPCAAGPVLVVAPPWADLARIVADAGGRPVGAGQARFASLAAGDGSDFSSRLVEAGAWLAFDGRFVAQICGAS